MFQNYTSYIRGLIRFVLSGILITNAVSCTFLGLSDPSLNGQNPSKRMLSASDKQKYSGKTDADKVYFFISPQPDPLKLPLPVTEINPEVKAQIDTLVSGRQRSLRDNLERGKEYAKMINQVFIDEGMPGELIYLAMIESGFQPSLKSPMGAAGLWQFMKSTARLYGLKITFFNDERKDVILSTIAASRHLKDLYEEFRDWKLVLAAYNAGPGAVERAISKYNDRNFWNLARKGAFRSETVTFVAKFYAINFIMKNPESFGLDVDCLTSYKGLNHSMLPPSAKKNK